MSAEENARAMSVNSDVDENLEEFMKKLQQGYVKLGLLIPLILDSMWGPEEGDGSPEKEPGLEEGTVDTRQTL